MIRWTLSAKSWACAGTVGMAIVMGSACGSSDVPIGEQDQQANNGTDGSTSGTGGSSSGSGGSTTGSGGSSSGSGGSWNGSGGGSSGSGGSGGQPCVDNVLCAMGKHWDQTACGCVPDPIDAGICVNNGACIQGTQWDPSVCTCVPEPTDAGACVQTQLCSQDTHWDKIKCACVAGACISQEGEHCGGFVVSPCTCATGLVCKLSNIPDIGGTCVKAN
jgi:hypothetical protein